MPASESSPAIKCPACGKSTLSDADYRFCPFCGNPLASNSGDVEDGPGQPPQALDDYLKTLDNRLAKTAEDVSDRAFNLGCGLGILLLVLGGTAVYFLGGRSWLLLIIAMILFSLAVLWLVILVTDVSRNRSMARVYREEIQPEIEGYCLSRQIEISDFEASAYSTLPDRAPLLKYIPKPPIPEDADLLEA